jgi:nucleotide-binding universal stress UspA family protein
MKTKNPNVSDPVNASLTQSDAKGGKAPAAGIRLNEILVPLDLSKMSLKALKYAVSFAQQYGARLTLLHVLEPITIATELSSPAPPTPGEFLVMNRELQNLRESVVPKEVAADTVVRHDLAADGILNAAREFESDMIIIATHGRTGIKHLVMGSTAEKVVRTATCPVMVVRDTERDFV